MSDARGEDVCPYQGLAPFGVERSGLFFGRVRAVRGLLGRVRERLGGGGVLLVSGASGVGKSSLLRAGLLPALGERAGPVVTPGAGPLRALAAAWAEAYGGTAEDVERRLRTEPAEVRAAGRPLVLVVDQFEELFTLVPDERERQAYVRALYALTGNGIGVVVGVRADYWDRCAAYPQFAEGIQDGQVIVEPMAESDLRLAITGPAAATGLELEPGLVDTILADLRADRAEDERYGAGALPLLSEALRTTWEHRENGRLTVRGYELSGGVRDSVRHTADAVLDGLPRADRTTALKIFRRLTLITAGGRPVRRSAALADLYAAASAHAPGDRARVDALVSAFAGRRLLTLHEDRAEIAHDVLLTAWPALRQWLGPDLTAQAVYDRLVEDAGEWEENHADPAFLYRGARLIAVDDSRPRWDRDPDSFPPPGPTVDRFVAASERAAREAGRRRRLVTAGLAVLTVAALAAAGVAVRSAHEAVDQRALALSRQLAAQSETTGDSVTAALLAVAAWRAAPTAEARHRLLVAASRPGRGTLTGHTNSVEAVVFSRDSRRIATGGRDGTARLWDAASRRQLGAPIRPPRLDCAGLPVRVALTPDGRTLATACRERVRFWDVRTHRERRAPLTVAGGVNTLAYSPDGRTLATGADRGDVRLWDTATGRPRGRPMGDVDTRPQNPHTINALVFARDGKHLVTASSDNTARMWDTATGEQAGDPFTGHSEDVLSVDLSADGAMLATSSLDGTTRLWDVRTREQEGGALKPAGGGHGISQQVAFSPDGTRVAGAGMLGTTTMWDTRGHEVVAALSDNEFPSNTVAFSPDGRLLAAGGDDGVVRLADPRVHRQIGTALPDSTAVALSPDGRTLATGGWDEDGPAVRLWDTATGRPVRRAPEFGRGRAPVTTIAFAPGGRTLMTAGRTGVQLWDVAARREIAHDDALRDLRRLSPDGRFIAANTKGAIRFWDVAHRRETGPRLRVRNQTDVVSGMAISPDGTKLAAACWDRRVRIFDVATRRPLGPPLPFRSGGFVDDVAFSPDGRTLALTDADSTVRLWDVARRRPVGAALLAGGKITRLAFGPDGTTLATGSTDDGVRLWDLRTYRQIGDAMTGHTADIDGVAYAGDGRTVATVSFDGTARLWNAALPADPVGTACANAGRSLTRAEWERYAPGEEYRRTCP